MRCEHEHVHAGVEPLDIVTPAEERDAGRRRFVDLVPCQPVGLVGLVVADHGEVHTGFE